EQENQEQPQQNEDNGSSQQNNVVARYLFRPVGGSRRRECRVEPGILQIGFLDFREQVLDVVDSFAAAAGRIESDRHAQEWQAGKDQADKSERTGRNLAFRSFAISKFRIVKIRIVEIRAARQPKQGGERNEAAQDVERRGQHRPEFWVLVGHRLRLQRGEALRERPVNLPELGRQDKNEGYQNRHNDRYEVGLKRGEDSLDVLAHDLTDRLFNKLGLGRADGAISRRRALRARISLRSRRYCPSTAYTCRSGRRRVDCTSGPYTGGTVCWPARRRTGSFGPTQCGPAPSQLAHVGKRLEKPVSRPAEQLPASQCSVYST